MDIQVKLEQYIDAPDVPEHSFEAGWEYELAGQYASAMGFYLKCAELTDNDLLAYECLMRKAICFNRLGGRESHLANCCQLAIALMPGRPEAYHYLSASYERTGRWHESYSIARAGQRLNAERDPVMFAIDGMDLDYPGPFAMPFQEAVALWWIGRFDDCRDKFKEVMKMDKVSKEYKGHCKWNIDNLEGRDADALAGIKKVKKGTTTNKDEIIKKMIAEKKK